MKVLIIGATGQLGRYVTAEAIAQGFLVTAFARNPQKLDAHPNLTFHSGNAYKQADIDAAVAEQDAVIVTIGSGMSRRNTIRSTSTRHTISAMEKHGVKRLICQSTLGAQESWDNLNFFWKRIMFGAIIRPIFKEHEAQERLVQNSPLDWTIVRPSAFKNYPANGNFEIDVPPTKKGLKLVIGKEDIAKFIVAQLRDDRFLHKAVGISC